MALHRNIGGAISIAGGATHFWTYSYPSGRDVGVAVAAPNLLESSVNIPLVASDQGVVARHMGDSTGLEYSVAIRNAGAGPLRYNLNIGDWT